MISNSNHTLEKAISYNSWLGSIPAGVCHLGVDDVALNSLSANGNQPSSSSPLATPYALCIARMNPHERYKGFDELITVWPELLKSRPTVELVLIGDGEDRPRLEQLARDRQAKVRFLGQVDDAVRDRYLQHCSVFVMPSRGEGFGLVYLEAMRVGKPVLTGNRDAGIEVIGGNIAGLAVDPLSSEQLLSALLELTGPRHAEFATASRNRYATNFTYQHFRDRFAQQVQLLLDQNQQSGA